MPSFSSGLNGTNDYLRYRPDRRRIVVSYNRLGRPAIEPIAQLLERSQIAS